MHTRASFLKSLSPLVYVTCRGSVPCGRSHLRSLPPCGRSFWTTPGWSASTPGRDTLNKDEKHGGRRGAFGRSFVRSAHFLVMEFVYDVTFRFEGRFGRYLSGIIGGRCGPPTRKPVVLGVGTTMGTDPKTGCSPVGAKDDVWGGDPRTDLALAVDTGRRPKGPVFSLIML